MDRRSSAASIAGVSSISDETPGKRVLIVLGGARTGGLNRVLVDRLRHTLAKSGAAVRLHDLLADGFDPVLRLADGDPHARAVPSSTDPLVARYQEDVRWAERYIVVHPVWWFAPPAILKGWIDRILVDGVALRQRTGASPEALLEGRSALVVQTFNTGRAIDRVARNLLSRDGVVET